MEKHHLLPHLLPLLETENSIQELFKNLPQTRSIIKKSSLSGEEALFYFKLANIYFEDEIKSSLYYIDRFLSHYKNFPHDAEVFTHCNQFLEKLISKECYAEASKLLHKICDSFPKASKQSHINAWYRLMNASSPTNPKITANALLDNKKLFNEFESEYDFSLLVEDVFEQLLKQKDFTCLIEIASSYPLPISLWNAILCNNILPAGLMKAAVETFVCTHEKIEYEVPSSESYDSEDSADLSEDSSENLYAEQLSECWISIIDYYSKMPSGLFQNIVSTCSAILNHIRCTHGGQIYLDNVFCLLKGFIQLSKEPVTLQKCTREELVEQISLHCMAFTLGETETRNCLLVYDLLLATKSAEIMMIAIKVINFAKTLRKISVDEHAAWLIQILVKTAKFSALTPSLEQAMHEIIDQHILTIRSKSIAGNGLSPTAITPLLTFFKKHPAEIFFFQVGCYIDLLLQESLGIMKLSSPEMVVAIKEIINIFFQIDSSKYFGIAVYCERFFQQTEKLGIFSPKERSTQSAILLQNKLSNFNSSCSDVTNDNEQKYVVEFMSRMLQSYISFIGDFFQAGEGELRCLDLLIPQLLQFYSTGKSSDYFQETLNQVLTLLLQKESSELVLSWNSQLINTKKVLDGLVKKSSHPKHAEFVEEFKEFIYKFSAQKVNAETSYQSSSCSNRDNRDNRGLLSHFLEKLLLACVDQGLPSSFSFFSSVFCSHFVQAISLDLIPLDIALFLFYEFLIAPISDSQQHLKAFRNEKRMISIYMLLIHKIQPLQEKGRCDISKYDKIFLLIDKIAVVLNITDFPIDPIVSIRLEDVLFEVNKNLCEKGSVFNLKRAMQITRELLKVCPANKFDQIVTSYGWMLALCKLRPWATFSEQTFLLNSLKMNLSSLN